MKLASPLRCLIQLSSLTKPRQRSSLPFVNKYRHTSGACIMSNSPIRKSSSIMSAEKNHSDDVNYCDVESDPSSYQTALSSMRSTVSSAVTTPRTSSQEILDASDSERHINHDADNKCNTGKLVVRILPRDCEDYQNVNLSKLQMYKVDSSKYFSDIHDRLHIPGVGQDENCMNFSESIKSGFNFDIIIAAPTLDVAEGVSNLVICMDLDIHFDISYTDRHCNSEEKSSHSQSRHERKSIFIHMNRNADEMANRTMKRLELSAAKKVSGVVGKPGGSGSRKKNKKQKKNTGGTNQSSVKIFLRNNRDKNELDNIDMEKCTALDLFQVLASKHDGDYAPDRTGLALPLMMPKHDNIITRPCNCNSDIDEDGNIDVELGIITNPPTIISIQTFEMFSSELFATVPITIQTELIHASKAIVSWFVESDGGSDSNGCGYRAQNIVLHDSHIFTPQACHIGKRLVVMVTPFRKDYNGPSFPETYRFVNEIKPLPYMPIVSPLRDDFTRSAHRIQHQLESGTEKNDVGDNIEVGKTQAYDNSIRVMTYNILADLYVSRDENIGTVSPRTSMDENCSDPDLGTDKDQDQDNQNSILYPHVKFQHLKKTRRMPMIVAEILAYDADIICLQEVDGSVYDTYLYPVMRASGYDGFYSNKASCQREGCVMFWKEDKYEGIDRLSYSVRDLFDLEPEPEDQDSQNHQTGKGSPHPQSCRWDSMKDIQDLLRNHEELRKVTMEKIGQVLQVAMLRLKKSVHFPGQEAQKTFVVANTHLFYHPKADHIRAMQAYVVCKKIDEVRRRCDGGPCPLLLCGDLNSDPLSGASQLLMSRSVGPDNYDCWKYLHEYRWEMGNTDYMTEHQYIGNKPDATDLAYEEEMFTDAKESANQDDSNTAYLPPLLALPDEFPDLVSGCTTMPEFTNYAVDFIDTLDYILASEPGLKCAGFTQKRSARMPTAEGVKQFVAMPNEFMPSDHVSVVCDFEWTGKDYKSSND